MKKDKLFAPFLTLLVAAITLFLCLYWGYDLGKIARILLLVIIFFYIVGSFVQAKVNAFIEANEAEEKAREAEEGAVIEKEAPDEEGEEESEEERFTLPTLTGAMPEVPGEANSDSEMFRTRNE